MLPGTPNWHLVLKKGRNPILLLSIQSGVCLIEVFLTIESSQIQLILVSAFA